MATAGKVVLREGGKRGVVPGGHTGVFDADGVCVACCGCEPAVVASKVTNLYDADFDLTPYRGDHVGPPNQFWRLIEIAFCLIYLRGCIDENGKLVGLPPVFHSGYAYNGYMELQVGCLGDDGLIHFPGACFNDPRAFYPC